MKPIPGGTFQMGSEAHYPEEAPVREVRLEPFRISPYAVTNEEYAAFVAATDPDAEPVLTTATRLGWTVVSMRSDWNRVFPG